MSHRKNNRDKVVQENDIETIVSMIDAGFTPEDVSQYTTYPLVEVIKAYDLYIGKLKSDLHAETQHKLYLKKNRP